MSKFRFVFNAMVLAMAGMVLVWLGVGQILADDWRVDTQRVLSASPAEVGALVRDCGTWSRWSSTEANLGASTTRVVVGEPGAKGHGITWTGPQGRATLLVTAATEGAVDYEFLGQGPGDADPRSRSRGRIEWAAEGERCRVRWRDEGQWGSTVARWVGWFGALQERLRELQASSLAGLQQEIETRRAAGQVREGK